MNIAALHPKYLEFAPKWARARDILAGQDRIRDAAEQYLPRLENHTDEEYARYLNRALFFNASGRTAAGFAGLIFRRTPSCVLPENNTALQHFLADCDLAGTSLHNHVRQLVDEILAVGRAGTWIDWEDAEQRARLALYTAENIINWRFERIGGVQRLSLLVLKETASVTNDFEHDYVKQLRVLRLVGDEDPDCVVQLWRNLPNGKNEPEWVLIEERLPLRRGAPLKSIPFVFHSAAADSTDPAKPPLEDLMVVNLDHYRLDAEYKHGLHYTAMPTAWLAGFDADSEFHIGASRAWVSRDPSARAGYLEFTGTGLGAFEQALERDEKLMALLGSRLLEPQRRVAETAEALSIRQGAEASILSHIARSISLSVTRALRWVYWWHTLEQSPDVVPASKVAYELNSDFETATMTSEELRSLVTAWQAGAISRDSMFNLMRQGEMLPAERTNAEEQKALAQT